MSNEPVVFFQNIIRFDCISRVSAVKCSEMWDADVIALETTDKLSHRRDSTEVLGSIVARANWVLSPSKKIYRHC